MIPGAAGHHNTISSALLHDEAAVCVCACVCAPTEGGSHGRVLHCGLAVSRWQVRPGEVTALLIVVLHVEAGEFGEVDPQSAAAVVDVLSIQRLRNTATV